MKRKKRSNKRIYIHYGDEHFQPEKFGSIKNCERWVKPDHKTGMWASPVKARRSWKKWCIDENFHLDTFDKSFKFVLKDNAHICHLRCVEDLTKLPRIKYYGNNYSNYFYYIDFEEAAKQFDAIELHLSEEPYYEFGTPSLYDALYGWDCDSILILNPDVVKEIR